MGLHSDLHILHAHLDMHRWLHPLLLLGWMARLSHEKSAPQFFHVQEQRKGQRSGPGMCVSFELVNQVCRSLKLTMVKSQGRGETAHNGFYGTVTTEVQVTHTLADSVPPEPQPAYIPRTTRHVSFDNPEPEIQPSSDNQYYSSVTTAPPQEVPPPPSLLQRFKTTVTAITSKFRVGDPIKRAYLRTSFLFALSVLVTWIPSSLNRIHGWLDGGSPYEFHVATAAVLPLQGLWNGIIFFVTSWRSIKAWINETFKASAAVIDRHKADELGMNERTAGPLNPLNRCESFMDDGDSATIGSDVELRRVPNSGTKTAHPL